MTQTAYTLPLSRWHHVADRIREIAERRHLEATSVLGGTSLSRHAPLGDAQVDALRKRGAKALERVGEVIEAQRVVGQIRVALAKANAEKGVSELLSLAEAKRRELRVLNDYAQIDLVTRVPLDQAVETLRNGNENKDGAPMRSLSLPVALVETDALDWVSDEIESLNSQVASLTDQVAELNRATLTIQLPAALAKAVGL